MQNLLRAFPAKTSRIQDIFIQRSVTQADIYKQHYKLFQYHNINIQNIFSSVLLFQILSGWHFIFNGENNQNSKDAKLSSINSFLFVRPATFGY